MRDGSWLEEAAVDKEALVACKRRELGVFRSFNHWVFVISFPSKSCKDSDGTYSGVFVGLSGPLTGTRFANREGSRRCGHCLQPVKLL